MEFTLVQYFALISAPVFLFGSIKLRKVDQSTGTSLLVLGFALLTLAGVLSVTEYLEVIKPSYHPYMENHYYSQYGDRFEQWERTYYWSKLATQWIACLSTAAGFYLLGRKTFSELRQTEQQHTIS